MKTANSIHDCSLSFPSADYFLRRIPMHQTNVSPSYDPNRLIDALLQWLELSSDKKLSRHLRVSPQIISGIRAGRLALRASILLWMAECAGRSIDELRRVLGDRRRKIRLPCHLLLT